MTGRQTMAEKKWQRRDRGKKLDRRRRSYGRGDEDWKMRLKRLIKETRMERRKERTASAKNPAPASRTRAVLDVRKLCSKLAALPADLSRLEIPIPD
jgi:hypothetical protein